MFLVDCPHSCRNSALEAVEPTKSGELFVDACSIFESENQLRLGVECFKRAIVFFLRKQE